MVLKCFSGKISKVDEFRQVTGVHSWHDTSNENGLKPIDFAMRNEMKIETTSYHKKTFTNICDQIDRSVSRIES